MSVYMCTCLYMNIRHEGRSSGRDCCSEAQPGRGGQVSHRPEDSAPNPLLFYSLLSKMCVWSVIQRCRILSDPMDDCSLLYPSDHGILQTRILEWVASPFSRGSSQFRDLTRSPALQADSLPSEPPGKPLSKTVAPKTPFCCSLSDFL